MDLLNALLGLVVFYFLAYYSDALLHDNGLMLLLLAVGVAYWVSHH
ncbi:MAG TPA: hypothetical protein VJI71_01000 [Candidatus Norongarragalinales archaeon]|nr:hypothetical protein [Candidatus Norongarragalinales archaeon]